MAKKSKRSPDPLFIVVDLFCGAGGTTSGFEMSNGMAKVIACVNHDPNAIKSHWLNHPDVVHFEEDIRTLKLGPLLEIVNKYRKLYPNAKFILWASLECTNFSKAKGGLPRDADSRTLADELERYIVALNPDIIQIENVVEFMSWGPLDENGKPISKKNGTEFMRWRKEICERGYVDEWKQLNAADFGGYTSRNRLFGMFSKKKDLIIFPEPTHCKNPSAGKMFAAPKKWKPVKDVLDFSDEGNSIFCRKKPLSPKTLERIYAGLIKYVAGGDKAFIAKYFSGNPDGKVKSVNSPAGTITTIDHHCLVQSKFLLNYHHSSDVNSIDNPCPTLVTRDKLAYVNTCFLTKYHGKGENICSIESPASTLSTKDRLAKIQPLYWMDRNFNNGGGHQPINQPAGTILSVPKLNLVKCYYFKTQAPPYIITTESGRIAIQIYETDTEVMIRIKKFMAAYAIIDIKMRMLKILELLKIQGFPNGYTLFGTQTDQKKFIGNSVHPNVVIAWVKAIAKNYFKEASFNYSELFNTI